MKLFSAEKVIDLLYAYNPWWVTGQVQKDFNKDMKRIPYYEALKAFSNKDIRRTVLLSGARRTGKTTIMYQSISHLLSLGVNPKNILFLSFDHPLLKMGSMDDVMTIYKNNITSEDKLYFFFDEVQYSENWNQWLKVFYDLNPNFHIMATGSASLALIDKSVESGLGRWITIQVPTLSFYEYAELLNLEIPKLPASIKPTQLYHLSLPEQHAIFNALDFLEPHFIRYLQVGGFPELALSYDDVYAQRILREDIVDKALKRDLPALYSVRNISDLEKLFVYLCYNSSNIVNTSSISKELDSVSRSTIDKYISYLESSNLIYVSPLLSSGSKSTLKARPKVYIADAALRNAVLMKDDVTNDPTELGIIAETAVYKHIRSFHYDMTVEIGYLRDSKNDREIDIAVQSNSMPYPILIEVKYREDTKIVSKDLIVEKANQIPNLVITKRSNDYGLHVYTGDKSIFKIPAPAFLFLLGYVQKQSCKK